MLLAIRAIKLDIIVRMPLTIQNKISSLTNGATFSTKCRNSRASSGSLKGHGRRCDRSGVLTTCSVGEIALLLVYTS